MDTELRLSTAFEFFASHSLSGFEKPHEHKWKLEVGICGKEGCERLLDLVYFRKLVANEIEPLQGTFLNDNRHLEPAAQKDPTCETLASHFLHRFQSKMDSDSKCVEIQPDSIRMTIYDTDQKPIGTAELRILKKN